MSKGILIQTSLKFSAKIIKLQQYLIKQKKETIISKHIIRSATSIGANINEADYIDNDYAICLLNDCLSIKKMLVSSLNTAKSNMK